jgi:hypothetical protein
MAFIVPKGLICDEILVAEVIRETKHYYVDKPMTPVLYVRDEISSGLIITGNVATYLVGSQLSLDEIPAMEDVSA